MYFFKIFYKGDKGREMIIKYLIFTTQLFSLE